MTLANSRFLHFFFFHVFVLTDGATQKSSLIFMKVQCKCKRTFFLLYLLFFARSMKSRKIRSFSKRHKNVESKCLTSVFTQCVTDWIEVLQSVSSMKISRAWIQNEMPFSVNFHLPLYFGLWLAENGQREKSERIE